MRLKETKPTSSLRWLWSGPSDKPTRELLSKEANSDPSFLRTKWEWEVEAVETERFAERVQRGYYALYSLCTYLINHNVTVVAVVVLIYIDRHCLARRVVFGWLIVGGWWLVAHEQDCVVLVNIRFEPDLAKVNQARSIDDMLFSYGGPRPLSSFNGGK